MGFDDEVRRVWELRNVMFGWENVLGVGGHGPSAVEVQENKGWARARDDGDRHPKGLMQECPVDAFGHAGLEAEEQGANARGVKTRGARGPVWLLQVFTS